MKQQDSGERLDEFLVSARSLAEYQAIFELPDADLADRRILDCPGGAASFTAEASALGARVTAADPIYTRPATELGDYARTETERTTRWARKHQHRYRWDWYGGPEEHAAIRHTAAARFGTDVDAHPERYVAARLPSLPFADDTFDLVLSSHLLFSYADLLDADFHLDALLELSRVARGETRIYPLLDHTGARLDDLVHELRTGLHDKGIDTALRHTRYEFHHGADTMLVLHRA